MVLLQASWVKASALGLSARGAVRRVHSYRLGRSRSRPSTSRAGIVPVADYADCLDGFLRALDLAHPYVAGLSFGAVLGLEPGTTGRVPEGVPVRQWK
jgi:pimeloyl-ACP methyl ester carboxylesterase